MILSVEGFLPKANEALDPGASFVPDKLFKLSLFKEVVDKLDATVAITLVGFEKSIGAIKGSSMTAVLVEFSIML